MFGGEREGCGVALLSQVFDVVEPCCTLPPSPPPLLDTHTTAGGDPNHPPPVPTWRLLLAGEEHLVSRGANLWVRGCAGGRMLSLKV